MNLILALAGDCEQIKALLMDCNLPTQDLPLAHLPLAHLPLFVLQDKGQLVGVVGLEIKDQFGLLRSLAVQAKFRGQGIGQYLVSHTEGYAATVGVHRLYLLTTTANQFFGSLGYKETSRQQVPAIIQSTAEFASICPSSAVCMVKQIQ